MLLVGLVVLVVGVVLAGVVEVGLVVVIEVVKLKFLDPVENARLSFKKSGLKNHSCSQHTHRKQTQENSKNKNERCFLKVQIQIRTVPSCLCRC